MTYLKGTKQNCEAYNQTVTQGRNLPAGTITKWAHVVQIADDFYIAKHPDYPSDLEQVESLPIQEESNDDI